MAATPSLRTRQAREGLARLVQQLAPGGRLVRTQRLRGGLGCRMDLLRIEHADGSRLDVSLRRFHRDDEWADPAKVPQEFEVLQLLESRGIPAPRPLWLDAAGDVFGMPAMAISYLQGAPLYRPADSRVWCENLARALLSIHSFTPDLHDLPKLPVELRDEMRAKIDKRRQDLVSGGDALAGEILDTLDAHLDHIGWPPATLVHDDYWPGNTVWSRGRLVGVIDWTSAKLGDPRTDVAQCRLDTIVCNDFELGDTFVEAYQNLASPPLPDLWYFDLFVGFNALLYYERWLVGYHDAGLTDLRADDVGARLRAFLRRVLDEHASRRT